MGYSRDDAVSFVPPAPPSRPRVGRVNVTVITAGLSTYLLSSVRCRAPVPIPSPIACSSARSSLGIKEPVTEETLRRLVEFWRL